VGVVLGGLIFAIYGLSVAHVNDLIDPTKTLEVTGGLLLLYGVGATVGPTLAGGVMDLLGAEGLMVYFAGILTGLTVITWYFTTTRRPSAGTRADHPDFVATVNSSQAMLQIDPRSHRGDSIPSTEPQNSH
jgi:MFS family permease